MNGRWDLGPSKTSLVVESAEESVCFVGGTSRTLWSFEVNLGGIDRWLTVGRLRHGDFARTIDAEMPNESSEKSQALQAEGATEAITSTDPVTTAGPGLRTEPASCEAKSQIV